MVVKSSASGAIPAAIIACLSLAIPASAGITNFSGCEGGLIRVDTAATAKDSELYYVSGAFVPSCSTARVRSGTYSLYAPGSSGGVSYAYLGQLASTGAQDAATNSLRAARWYAQFDFFPASPEPFVTFLSGTPSAYFHLSIDSDGIVDLIDWDGTPIASGSTALSVDTWYLMQFKTDETNSYLYIDGAQEISGGAGQDIFASVAFGKYVNWNGNSVYMYFDDMAVGTTYETIPDGQVRVLAVNGQGNGTAWTGDYTDVDDYPHDSGTSTINTSSASSKESTAHTDTSGIIAAGDTINAVKTLSVGWSSVSQALSVQHYTRVNSVDYNLSDFNEAGTNIFRQLASVRSVDPGDSSAWTTSDVDSVEAGIMHNQAQSRQANATTLVLQVDFLVAESVTLSGGVNSWW